MAVSRQETAYNAARQARALESGDGDLLVAASPWLFFASLAAFGAVLGFLDMAMNAEASAIEHDLRRPIFRKTAAYGHFGRTEPEFTWESTDRAKELARAAATL